MTRVLRETHEAPENVVRALAVAGGLNRFGEPNFRAVWGGTRLGWIGGKWEDRDASGELIREVVAVRREPKYVPLDRWHIERWCPPEMYGSPEDWARATAEAVDGKSVPALGPYPSRGEYEHVMTLEGPRGEFVQLTPTVVERLARMVERSRELPRRQRLEGLRTREATAESRHESWADSMLSDAGPAFHGVPHAVVSAAI